MYNNNNLHNIVIISDDKMIRTEAVNLLESDYNVFFLAGIQIERIRNFDPVILIIDLALKTADLPDCLQNLQNEIDVPLLLIAADIELKDITRIKELDCAGFVPRPFTKAELLSGIAAALTVNKIKGDTRR